MAVDISGMMSENVILIDSKYADKVAFNLSVMFERGLERRIPKADLAHWLDCLALDGGIEPGENAIQVIFLYDKSTPQLSNFNPGNFADDIDGKAFKDGIGEFAMEAYPIESDVTDVCSFFADTLTVLADSKDVKRIMIVPDTETYGAELKGCMKKIKDKDITLFAMEPQTGSGFSQEILGYSIMSALGIRGDEIK